MQALRERIERGREAIRHLLKLLVPVSVPVGVAFVTFSMTAVFGDGATDAALNDGLVALITVNAVVVGLGYSTMQQAVSLRARTVEGDSFAFGVSLMVVCSMLGVLCGIVHLVWNPDWPGFLSFTAGFLVGAPVLVPVLAIQERIVKNAEATRATEASTFDDGNAREDHVHLDEDAHRIELNLRNPILLRVRQRDFVANTSDPFANDVLDREPFVKAFCSALGGIEAPAVLSVDAGWGAGKTAFVKMCAAWIGSDGFHEHNQKMTVVEFNAWTQNYTNNALTDIVGAVTRQISDNDIEHRREIATILRQQAAKIASGGLLTDQIFTIGDGPQREIETFKRALRDYVTSRAGRLVVFVDELDRCRPDYAMTVLEKLRHLFDVQDVLVVLAVNRQALDQAVLTIRGLKELEDTSERYLRRFVDQTIWLPAPSDATIEAFVQHLCDETRLSERLNDEASTRPMFDILVGLPNNSLRSVEQTVHRTGLVFASIPEALINPMETPHHIWSWKQAAITLMILREVDRDTYQKFTNGTADAFDAGQALRASLSNVKPDLMLQMELALLLAYCKKPARLYQGSLWSRYLIPDRKEDMEKLRKEYDELWEFITDDRPDISHLASIIEMTHFDPIQRIGSRFALDGAETRLLLIHHRTGEMTGIARERVDEDRVTVIVEPESPKAVVTIDPPDAQPDMPGHQVDLPDGKDTTITVTTTAEDETISTYQLIAERSSSIAASDDVTEPPTFE